MPEVSPLLAQGTLRQPRGNDSVLPRHNELGSWGALGARRCDPLEPPTPIIPHDVKENTEKLWRKSKKRVTVSAEEISALALLVTGAVCQAAIRSPMPTSTGVTMLSRTL